MLTKAIKRVRHICGTALVLMVLTVWVGHAFAGDVEIQLPSSNGSDAFQVEDALSNAILHVQSDGRVGIGTTNPHNRKLHVSTDGNLVKFEYTGTGNHAALDLDSPYLVVGEFCRLDWRSLDSASHSDQFAAIDVVYRDKTSGSEDADMMFRTMNDGSNDAHVVISHEGYMGIGYLTPSRKLDVKDTQTVLNVASFENESNSSNGDVMNLTINRNNPTIDNRFITFRDSGGVVGRIQGDGFGGISFLSGAGDFAEWLPRLASDEIIEAGDIVGVFGGKITKTTSGADQLLAVSTAPLILGNDPGEKNERFYEKVAFLGQIPVKVRGPVRSGDYIVPSGLEDGTGIAIAPLELTPDLALLVVGKARENATDENTKRVSVDVGRHTVAHSLYTQNKKMEREIGKLAQTNEELLRRLEALECQVRSLQQEK